MQGYTLILASEREVALIRAWRRANGEPDPEVDNPETHFLGELRHLLGEDAANRDGGKWRNRWRTHREAAETVLRDLARRIGAGQPIREPGAYLEFAWRKHAQLNPEKHR